MKILLSFGVFLGIVLLCKNVSAQESPRQLSFMMSVSGTCTNLMLSGEALDCQGTLIHTEYDDGRLGFYFVAKAPNKKIITFSGRGQEQRAPSENVRIQPIDGVILSDGIVNASGECLFENPYAGPAQIRCAAKSASGSEYFGQFLTDGAEPRNSDLGN